MVYKCNKKDCRGIQRGEQIMWIASPEKTLIIDGDRFFVDEESDGRSYIYVNGNPVASYSTHERAMKVMDMIQNAITGTRFEFTDIVRDCDLAGIEIHNVFNMPKDDEVEV